MFKKCFSLLLVFLTLNLTLSSVAFGQTKLEKEAKHAEKVKAEIAKRGVGTKAKVEVKLNSGEKIKGYVSNVAADTFTVTSEKTGTPTEVSYQNAKQVKGKNLSTGSKILIGVGIGVAVWMLAAIVYLRDGGQ